LNANDASVVGRFHFNAPDYFIGVKSKDYLFDNWECILKKLFGLMNNFCDVEFNNSKLSLKKDWYDCGNAHAQTKNKKWMHVLPLDHIQQINLFNNEYV
jgi:hypothetical protein